MEPILDFSTLSTPVAGVDSMQNQDNLLEKIAAALNSPSTSTEPVSFVNTPQVPIISDMGNILLHLTQAVAQAKSEAERERSLRLALEAENQQLLMSSSPATGGNFGGPESVDASYYDVSSPSTLPSTLQLSLTEALSYISSMPPHMQDCVYVSYRGSGGDLRGYDMITAVITVTDFSDLVLVMFPGSYANTNLTQATGMVKYSVENLQGLLTGRGSSSTITTYPTRVVSPSVAISSGEEGEDENDSAPRMNLLEALNVQSDDDIRRIITVRKCHKLGFKSHVFLKQYFQRFGKVERVVLLPMRAKPRHGDLNRGNRPSSMGFVVMENEDLVKKVLEFDNASGVHIIKGWPIEVRNFVRPADKPDMMIPPFLSSNASNSPSTATAPASISLLEESTSAESLW